jgi:hypothetical protein
MGLRAGDVVRDAAISSAGTVSFLGESGMSELIDARWQKFEGLGEEQVARDIAGGVYDKTNALAARAYLVSKKLAREETARRSTAASAAERSAAAAKSAKKRATIAIAIAIVSLAVTMVIAVVDLLSVHALRQ